MLIIFVLIIILMLNSNIVVNLKIQKMETNARFCMDLRYLFFKKIREISFEEILDLGLLYMKNRGEDLNSEKITYSKKIINKFVDYAKKFYNIKNLKYIYTKIKIKSLKSNILFSSENMNLSIIMFMIFNIIYKLIVDLIKSDEKYLNVEPGFTSNIFKIDSNINIKIKILDILKILIYVLKNENKDVNFNE